MPAYRARKGGLSMDEISGGTFTISNVSMLGVDGFTPILNPPETGILGVGRVVEKPGVFDGQVCVAQDDDPFPHLQPHGHRRRPGHELFAAPLRTCSNSLCACLGNANRPWPRTTTPSEVCDAATLRG